MSEGIDIPITAATEIDDLVGTEADFYGVDGNCFKLDDIVYEAIEDEDNGYRSMLGCIEVCDESHTVFFRMPVARVVVENDDDLDGYKLIDLHDGHVWLRFGTQDYDDYYPMFLFDYTPKAPQD